MAKIKKLSEKELVGKQMSHQHVLAPMSALDTGQDSSTLGHARAVVIVCACANTSPLNLSRTLEELGIDGISFQSCVFNGVRSAGYSIGLDEIPNAPDTTLIDVVIAIQDAPKSAAQMTQAALLAPMHATNVGQDSPTLTHARAVVIVCTCAGTTPLNLSRTLEQLGVDGISFQSCVFNGVRHVGYTVPLDEIPDATDTALIDVVIAIQNVPRA